VEFALLQVSCVASSNRHASYATTANVCFIAHQHDMVFLFLFPLVSLLQKDKVTPAAKGAPPAADKESKPKGAGGKKDK
jgi:hypothetical protein